MPNSLKTNKKHPDICSSQNILVLGSKKMLREIINLLIAVISLLDFFFFLVEGHTVLNQETFISFYSISPAFLCEEFITNAGSLLFQTVNLYCK